MGIVLESNIQALEALTLQQQEMTCIIQQTSGMVCGNKNANTLFQFFLLCKDYSRPKNNSMQEKKSSYVEFTPNGHTGEWALSCIYFTLCIWLFACLETFI